MIPRKDDAPGKAKPFSVPFSTAPKKTFTIPQSSRPPSGPAGRQRHRHLTHDDSDEEEAAPAHEEVTEFDISTGGAISKNAVSKEKEPLVIKVESGNNWRDRPGVNRRGKKNLLPQEVQAARNEGAGVVETEAPTMAYGLSVAPSKKNNADDIGRGKESEEDVSMTDTVTARAQEPREPLTQDEAALQALIRESEGGDQARRPDLIIESVNHGRYDETSSFRADVATRPDQASLADYDAVPVEEFGAALLRGMGWKEGQSIGRRNYGNTTEPAAKVRIPERRPGFLGIGAKDISGGKGAELELGAWGKAAMRKGSKKNGDGSGNTDGVYMPIVMKSKKTGEHLTEEEFKLRQKEASEGRKSEKRDDRFHSTSHSRDRDRSRRYDDDDDDDDESDTDRDRRRSHGKSSSRRDRSQSAGESDRRSRRHEDEGTRYSRDSRRYRDRDDSDYKSRPRSRDRSHRDYGHSRRDKDFHRTRDRDRDSDRPRSDRDRDRYRDSRR